MLLARSRAPGGRHGIECPIARFNLSRLIYHYTNGRYQNRGTMLYVDRGIGTTGFPIRLGARPEVTLFVLTRT